MRFIGLIGMALILGIAYLASSNRSAIRWKTVIWGIVLQLIFAVFILRFSLGQTALSTVAHWTTRLISYADKGSGFVFGYLATDPQYATFAFKVLPIVIFISSFFSMLYYLGVMQILVQILARIMTRFMGVSGTESLAAAANVFMGQTEAPIIIAPYIPQMTYSELMALMTGGMATVSGAILGAYIALGINAEYLISASVMAAPASLLMAKILIPETEVSKTAGKVTLKIERHDANLIDAAARGAAKGVQLAINIAAMLIAFLAIIYLVNGIIAFLGRQVGLESALGHPVSVQLLIGYLLSPVTFLMGVPWSDANSVAQLIGVKVVLNEMVAYTELASAKVAMSPKAELIATYALCGFANLGSIGIQIGGIGPLAPNQKSNLARLGMRALLAGTLASLMTATLAGMLV